MIELKDGIEYGRERIDQKSSTEIRFTMHAVDGIGITKKSIEEFEGPR